MEIEVETENLSEVEEALRCDVDIIMLDKYEYSGNEKGC